MMTWLEMPPCLKGVPHVLVSFDLVMHRRSTCVSFASLLALGLALLIFSQPKLFMELSPPLLPWEACMSEQSPSSVSIS